MPNTKKVIYVITKSNWGGAQKYVYDLAASMPQVRFEVVVAAGSQGPLFDKLHETGIKTIPILGLQRDINIWKEFLSFFSLLYIFLKEKPDIIHLNSSKIGGLGALAAFIYKILQPNLKPRVIFTVHGWGFKEDRRIFTKILLFLISWLSSLFQDKVILINNSDYQSAKKFIPQRKLSLVYNGIGSIPLYSPKQSRAFLSQKVSRSLGSKTIAIGTIAELTKNKGLQYLVDAIKKVKARVAKHEVRNIIIGEGEDREKLQERIKTHGLDHSVFLTGFIPEAGRYLNGFDIFVLPSVKEGLPYTILEAMAAGLPVIATNVGGVPDLIEHGRNGILVEPKDPQALSSALANLVSSRTKRRYLGIKAKNILEKKFTLRDMIEKTISIYEENA